MEKSRLGISINLFAALLCFICAIDNLFIAVFIVGYILLFETDNWLKKTAVKVLILAVLLSIITFLLQYLGLSLTQLFNFLRNLKYNYIVVVNGEKPSLLDYLYIIFATMPNLIQLIAYVVRAVIFIVLGFKIYKQQDIKIKWIDNIIDKHLLS